MRAWTTAGAEPPHKGVLVAVMQGAELLERHSLAGQYGRWCGRASKVCACKRELIVLEEEKEVYVHQGETLTATTMENVRFLINVGSIGQPRDRNPKSSYGILDTESRTFRYHRVEYDVHKTQTKMRKIKMPEFLITRLEEGR